MGIGNLIVVAPLFALLIWAAMTDLNQRRIPNWLSLALATMGVVQAFMPIHLAGPANAVAGMLVGMLLNVGLWALGVRGGGDVKLFTAVGAWVGARDIVIIFLVVAILDMLWAVLVCMGKGKLSQLATNTMALVTDIRKLKTLTIEGDLVQPAVAGGEPLQSAGKRVPLAVTLLVATLTVQLTGSLARWQF